MKKVTFSILILLVLAASFIGCENGSTTPVNPFEGVWQIDGFDTIDVYRGNKNNCYLNINDYHNDRPYIISTFTYDDEYISYNCEWTSNPPASQYSHTYWYVRDGNKLTINGNQVMTRIAD